MTGCVVIGIGNPMRRDDGVGPAVVAALADHVPGTRLVVTDGEPTTLLEAWRDAQLAVVIDAIRAADLPPGTIRRVAVADAVRVAGSHDFGLAQTLRLSAALDRSPRRLVVYGVQVADVGFGVGLSAPVREAVPELRRRIVADVAGTAVTSAAPS